LMPSGALLALGSICHATQDKDDQAPQPFTDQAARRGLRRG